MREIIEPEIAALAAERADAAQIAALREAIERMDGAAPPVRALHRGRQRLPPDTRAGDANPLILSLVDSIVDLLAEQRTRIFSAPGGPERGQVNHRALLEAVERRDVEVARAAMRAHLAQVARGLRKPHRAVMPHDAPLGSAA